MRVKLNTTGAEVVLPDDAAFDLIAAGLAEPVKIQPPIETAVVHEALETATRD